MQPLRGSRSVPLLLFLRAGGAGIPSKSGSAEGATLCRGSRGVPLLLFSGRVELAYPQKAGVQRAQPFAGVQGVSPCPLLLSCPLPYNKGELNRQRNSGGISIWAVRRYKL